MLLVSGELDAVAQFFTVLIIFIAVLALTYYTTKWTANYQKGKLSSKNIEVIETYKLTTNKYIQIVRIGEKYLVLALCKDTITMLTELNESEIQRLEESKEKGLRFQDVLEKAGIKKSKK
ncbi:MAG: flagellar biosynthetic protein FliO [Clostridiales bacterium]|nr:flagellar biosynthetic protein FliO [Clostridiales bacterium]